MGGVIVVLYDGALCGRICQYARCCSSFDDCRRTATTLLTGRDAGRRSDGLRLEVPHQPAGRRVRHLRAAARLPDLARRLRCRQPGHPSSLGGDRSRVRGGKVKILPFYTKANRRAHFEILNVLYGCFCCRK